MPRRPSIASAAFTIGLLLLAPQRTFAWQAATKPAREQVSAGMPTGTRAYAGGHWGLVEVQVVNRSDEPAKVVSAMFFGGDANLQYGREFWLPARSKRHAWHPVLLPEDNNGTENFVRYDSLLFERTGDDDRVVATPTGQMLNDGLLPLDREGRLTCAIAASGPEADPARAASIFEMVAAARLQAGLSRKVSDIRGLVLPYGAETLQGMQTLVLSSDRPLNDPAGLLAIRNWVLRGGRLWVVLNDVSPEVVNRLFGDACRLHVVDRVGLTEVQIEGEGSASKHGDAAGREFEQPIEMVRVLCDDVEVLHTVNGWPASFMTSIGRGSVLVTTVESRAWLRPRRPADPPPPDGTDLTPNVAGNPLAHLAERLLTVHEEPPPPTTAWQPFLAEQIGHRIVGRGTVFGILGAFCVSLVVAAVGFNRRGRLDRLGWAAPLAAVATAAVLAFVGMQSAESVPSTIAEGQLIETSPGAATVHATGLSTFYRQSPTSVELGAEGGGILVPDRSGDAGEVRRMIWTDWNRWAWENLSQPSGTRVASFQKDVRLDSPVLATATFGPEGLVGSVAGSPGDFDGDLVLATPEGVDLAPRPITDGRFVAAPDDVLDEGVYSSAALTSDVQRRRQTLLHEFLTARGRLPRFRDRPTLLGWTKPLDLGFTYPKDVQRTGDALVVVPIVLEQTPPGTDVLIPSPFVAHEPVPRPDGRTPSPLFNRRLGEWVEFSGNIESWLRFQLPPEVTPLELGPVEVSLVASGSLVELELLGLSGDKVVSLRKWRNPTGTLRHEIEGDALPAVDDSGGVRLGFRMTGVSVAGDPDSNVLRQYWRVEAVRLEATGRTIAAPAAP